MGKQKRTVACGGRGWRPNRREVLRAGGALAVTSFMTPMLYACGGGGDSGQLRFAAWGTEIDLKVKDRQAKLYERQNSSVQIEPEYTVIDQYFEKLATQASGGNAPDVFQMDVEELAQYAERGLLLDLGGLGSDVVDTSSFSEDVLRSSTIEGSLVALPLGSVASPALIYDATELEKIGVEPPGENLTLEGFGELARQIAEASGEDGYGTSDLSGSISALDAFIRGLGKELYDEEGQLGYGKEDLMAWFEYWDRLRRAGAIPPADVQAGASNVDFPNSLLVRGQAPMLFTPSSSSLRRVQALMENELSLAPYPTAGGTESNQTVNPIAFYAASAASDNQEEAARFASFCLNDKEAAPLFAMSYGIPPNRQIADSIIPDLDGVDRKHYDYVRLVGRDAQPPPDPGPPGAAEMQTVLESTSEDIAFERAKIDQAVDKYFSEAERVLA